jgi:hypothetical protein
MAVELSNHLQASLGVKLPSTLAFEHPTLTALTDYLATDVLGLGTADAGDERGDADAVDARAASIAGLTDDEVEDTLLKELERAGY